MSLVLLKEGVTRLKVELVLVVTLERMTDMSEVGMVQLLIDMKWRWPMSFDHHHIRGSVKCCFFQERQDDEMMK